MRDLGDLLADDYDRFAVRFICWKLEEKADATLAGDRWADPVEMMGLLTRWDRLLSRIRDGEETDELKAEATEWLEDVLDQMDPVAKLKADVSQITHRKRTNTVTADGIAQTLDLLEARLQRQIRGESVDLEAMLQWTRQAQRDFEKLREQL